MKYLLALSLLTTISLNLEARTPAINPVMGISIDDEKPVPPSKARGFDWKQDQKKADTSEKTKTFKREAPKNSRDTTTIQSVDLTPAVFLFLMLVLPFGIWYYSVRQLKEEEQNALSKSGLPENTLPFGRKDNGHDDSDDDFDVPKAS